MGLDTPYTDPVGISARPKPRVRPARGTGAAARREAIPQGTLKTREQGMSAVSQAYKSLKYPRAVEAVDFRKFKARMPVPNPVWLTDGQEGHSGRAVFRRQ